MTQLNLLPPQPSLGVIIDDPLCLLLAGDAVNLNLPAWSVDAIVTDPPADIGFMARGWDDDKGGRDAWGSWLAKTMRPSFDALKPGGHALVWALPRTSHWTATAVENLGFEIRDIHHHLFGTGFPKSMNVAKAGAGDVWDGWGTALKPACEHWILCRKPLDGTVASNVRKHGVGGLNIDGCRIGENPGYKYNAAKNGTTFHGEQGARTQQTAEKRGADVIESSQGRWPAHVALSHAWPCWAKGPDDYLCPICGEVRQSGECGKCGIRKGQCSSECPVAMLDEQAGERKSGERKSTHKIADRVGQLSKGNERGRIFKDAPPSTGGASRFFYVAKGSRAEKDAGLAHLPPRTAGEATDREEGSAGLSSPRTGAGRTGGARNFHPTVKSIALMRWLVRLITPPGGVILDPFAGSGSTGVAALAEGMRFIGIEQGGDDGEYLPIIEGRLRHALGGVA
jgi:hypothetical protein